MKVTLVSHTPDALNLLLRTKNTRLKFDRDPSEWSDAERREHLEYMRDTIKSSWEFVDYVFRIEGVTRAFTHQLVRTRTGSYAQEAQRVIDASEHPVVTPPSILQSEPAAHSEGAAQGDSLMLWEDAVQHLRWAYTALLTNGVAPQDARGLLPTNITTSIMAKFNLRTLHETAKLRLCTRTQGEYQDVFRAMRVAVIEVHPWAEEFLEVQCVATGTCAFPRYGKEHCPVYMPEMDNTAVRAAARERFWSVRHESAPIVKDGRSVEK